MVVTKVVFHDVDREVYELVDVKETSGTDYVWKQLDVGPVQLVFFPGTWRTDGPATLSSTSFTARYP